MKALWRYFLKMAIPAVEMAGEAYINQDDNDTGQDDLIGRTLLYIVVLIKAVLSGDANKIQHELNRVASDIDK
jgi:hypothetical protein